MPELFQPAFRIAGRLGGKTLTVNCQTSVRAGANADVVAVSPVNQIVPRLRPVAGVIADLVGGHTKVGADVAGQGEHIGSAIFVRQAGKFASVIAIAKSRALFDGQLIQGKMVYRHVQSLFQLGFPFRQSLFLPAVNQIETDPIKGFACDVKGRACFVGRMNAPQPAQIRVVQCLNAHRNAVDAARSKIGKPLCLDRPGVRL